MSAVHVVAVVELRGDAETAAKELAGALGTTAYELRLTLAGGAPAVVLFTPDEAKARAALSAFQRAGHRAVSADRAAAVPSARMTPFRDFRFEAGALVPSSSGADSMALADVVLLARASHRTQEETTTQVKSKKLDIGRAAMTGGLVMTKTVTSETTTTKVAREQVLYVFDRNGRAFILRERGALYMGLGADAGRTSFENFTTTIGKLRALSPAALYDERLMTPKTVRGVPDAILATDLLAHLLAVDARNR